MANNERRGTAIREITGSVYIKPGKSLVETAALASGDAKLIQALGKSARRLRSVDQNAQHRVHRTKSPQG